MVVKLPDLSVDERKAKVTADRASRDNYDPSIYFKDLHHVSVSFEYTQYSFECQ